MMTIVIDGRMYQQSGIGRYLRNLISSLQRIDNKNQYYILHLREDYDTTVYHNNFKKALADFRWYGLAEQKALPRILNSLKPDLVHFPHFNVPIFYRGEFIVTIHDLIHQHYKISKASTLDPITYRFKQFGYKKVFEFALKRSTKILTPTYFVKNQLAREWSVSNDKIEVTYEAVDDEIINLSKRMTKEESLRLIKKVGVNVPYIFYIGNAHPHKNVEGLIRAFRLVGKKQKDLHLVLSGSSHIFWDNIKKQFQDKNIIYTGYVDDETMVALYKNAATFVMPSFEEGFGLPLLEALVCGCPVVASYVGAIREIGNGAVCYFNPKNVDDIAKKIERVIEDMGVRRKLVEKGEQRYKEFSWARLAKKTRDTYIKVAATTGDAE